MSYRPQQYTVVSTDDHTDQTYTDWVWAETPEQARSGIYRSREEQTITVRAVFLGGHIDYLANDEEEMDDHAVDYYAYTGSSDPLAHTVP